MRMRWVLTKKSSGEAKARLVIKGYEDRDLSVLATASPTCSRRARNFVLLIAAQNGWKLQKGDVTAAFLQAGATEEDRNSYVEPPPDVKKDIGMDDGDHCKLIGPGYGTVHAPRCWWQKVRADFKSLGTTGMKFEPCVWGIYNKDGQLVGLAMSHVDDFVFAGNPHEEAWTTFLGQAKSLYNWGSWETDNITQCGVHITEMSDGGFLLKQTEEIKKVKEISLDDGRRKVSPRPLTPTEVTKIRGVCGECQWYGTQTAPQALAKLAEIMATLPKADTSIIKEVNAMVRLLHECADVGIRIFAHEKVHFLGWSDATWGSRPDGSSQGGQLITVCDAQTAAGELGTFSVVDWGTKKLRRVARSSLSAEMQAASDCEGELLYCRMAYLEMQKGHVSLENPNEVVKEIPADLITDSKALYDSLMKNESACLGLEERRSGIEGLALKESLGLSGCSVRWIHSHAQLADGLTKSMAIAQDLLRNFLRAPRWRIIFDERYLSARKRLAAGIGIFDRVEEGDREKANEVLETRATERAKME